MNQPWGWYFTAGKRRYKYLLILLLGLGMVVGCAWSLDYVDSGYQPWVGK